MSNPNDALTMNSDDTPRPDYMNHPIVGKYVHQLFHLIDELHQETDGLPLDDEVFWLRDTLRTLFTSIALQGELEELNTILRLHYPDANDPEQKDSLPILTQLPLSTSN